MRKLIVFIVLLVCGTASAQPVFHAFWEAQHPSPQGNTLRSVKMFDSSNFIMCGDLGAIVSTTNNGETWKVQAKIGGFDKQLNAIEFSDRAHGVTCGFTGTIFYTADSGNTWKKATSSNTINLNAIAYATPRIVVAVGQSGTFIRSVDSGKNWASIAIEASEHIRCVTFISPDSGFAVSTNGFIYESIDSGAVWTIRASAFTNNLLDIHFHPDHREVALAGENGAIYLSNDGGKNFKRQTSVNPWGNINAIVQLTPTTVVAACDFRAIYVTTNSGADWKNVMPFGSDNLRAIAFSDLKQGVAVGSNGIILRTYDGGMTWEALFDRVSPDQSQLRGIAAIDDNTIVSCGSQGLIVKSTTAGKSWRKIPSSTFNQLNAIHFSSPKVGTIVGDSGLVLRTQNGGESWYKILTPVTSELLAVSFLDSSRGIVVGRDGVIIRTNNGGKDWNRTHFNDTAIFYAASFNTPTNVVIGGVYVYDLVVIPAGTYIGPVFAVSDDGGFSFTHAKLNIDITGGNGIPSSGIRSLSFPTPNIGYAAVVLPQQTFAVGGIVKTTDGGHTWDSVARLTHEPKALSFKRPDFGTVVGVKGKTWHTTTGGATWDTIESNTGLDLFGVSHSSLGFAWACGARTIIIREVTDDIEQPGAVDSPSPSVRHAEMLSNYPNPFTKDGTTFGLKLPEASRITLRLYSELGVEVETIYDGFFPEGEHTIGFAPKALSSGIYFAILEACGKRELLKIVMEK